MFERKGVITVPVDDGRRGHDHAGRGRRRAPRTCAATATLAGHDRAARPRRACATRSRRPASRSTSAELTLLPKTQVEVDAEQARTLLRLVDALEESDDVQDVYFNFDIPDAVLEAVAG